VSGTGAAGCTGGRGLDNANHVSVSPDGASVYVASYLSDGVAAFGRDPATGALTRLPGAQGV